MMTLPCSDQSAEVGEQLAGSAPVARAWVALEQPGPWGRKAFTESHLDPACGRRLEETAAACDVRPALVRRPGRHADDAGHRTDDTRHVLVAHTAPGGSWLLEGTVSAPDELLAADWAAVRDGDLDAVRRSLPTLAPSRRAHLLVCTNGRRDVCCAVKGRPIALGMASLEADRVWEVTHTSGHRFAPTAVVLPAGTLHGRLDQAGAERLLAAADAGKTMVEGSRGRSTWSGPGQVAELAVREQVGELGLDALAVDAVDQEAEHRWTVAVSHADGRSWRVGVESSLSSLQRGESCGKEAVALRRWSWTLLPNGRALR